MKGKRVWLGVSAPAASHVKGTQNCQDIAEGMGGGQRSSTALGPFGPERSRGPLAHWARGDLALLVGSREAGQRGSRAREDGSSNDEDEASGLQAATSYQLTHNDSSL